MPREKDFDQQAVVKKCIDLFAHHGYSATGIQEIVDNTGINRSSLYSTFKGKDELFLTCLKKVMQEEILSLEALQKKLSPIKLIDAYLASVTKDKAGYHLLKFATAEFKLLNKRSQTAINAHYQWKQTFFEGVLMQAQKNGKLSKKIEVGDMVSLLELIVQGVQNFSHLNNADRLYKKPSIRFSKLIQRKKA